MVSIREDIYKFIVDYIKKNQFPPTVQEIRDGVSLKSTSSVFYHLKTMAAMGMIELPFPKAPRAIRVPGYHFVKDLKRGEEESHGGDGTCHESAGS